MKKSIVMLTGIAVIIGAIVWYVRRDSFEHSLTLLTKQQEGFGDKAVVVSLPQDSKVLIVRPTGKSITKDLAGFTSLSEALAQTSLIVINGDLVSSHAFKELVPFMLAYPYQVLYLMGHYEEGLIATLPDTSYSKQMLLTLPKAVYIVKEGASQPSLLISPTSLDVSQGIRCNLIDKDPIRSLCILGDICSFKQKPIATTIIGTEQSKSSIHIIK